MRRKLSQTLSKIPLLMVVEKSLGKRLILSNLTGLPFAQMLKELSLTKENASSVMSPLLVNLENTMRMVV
jgi:hypothetical protein